MTTTETTTDVTRPEGLVKRVKLLAGHTSPDTAYVVDDYPYGRRVRCQIRYWVETGTKGAGRGRQRFGSQTTNPKRGNDWSKPNAAKYSTYSDRVFMYLNEENGHVDSFSVDRTYMTPEGVARFYQRGLRDQITAVQRQEFDGWVEAARKAYPAPWTAFAERVKTLADHLATHDGEFPKLDESGRWTLDDGTVVYLGMRHEVPVYLTAAWGAWRRTVQREQVEAGRAKRAEEPVQAAAAATGNTALLQAGLDSGRVVIAHIGAATPKPDTPAEPEPEPEPDVNDQQAHSPVDTPDAEPAAGQLDEGVDPDDVAEDVDEDEIEDEDPELAAAFDELGAALAEFQSA